MYFKRIELHGFKSFAEPTVIEFDRGITCVVGPNGSGKSNICDAIRWVLGAQSAKALRGDKMEDVIFSGSSSRKSRGMAEVTLVIDNEDGALPIDYNEVAITRRMYRSGESEYLINNNRCRMRDIRELIMDTGIGVEGYSIIGQGKISDIISNNTESIREILEETAGIVMYRTRKAETERKLKSATDNLDRVNDIIGEIEGRIGGLKTESERAAEYLELRDRYRELEINITLRNIENIERRSEEIRRDLKELDEGIAKAGLARETLQASLNAADETRKALDTKIDGSHEKERLLSEEISRLTGERQVDKERLRSLTEHDLRLGREIEELSARIAGEEEGEQSLAEDLAAAERAVDALRGELDQAVALYTERNGRAAGLLADIDEKKNLLFALQSQISTYEAEIASIESLKETLARRRATLLSEGEGDETTGRDARQSLADLKRDQRALQERAGELEKALGEAKEEREGILEQQALCRDEIGVLTLSMGEDAARKKTLEEMESSYEGYRSPVRFIMQSGQPGLLGVAADLMRVPGGMETAIETALGGALQNVVCEDEETAKAAIRRLKEEKAGRLTFLPLTGIRPRPVITDEEAEKAEGFIAYGVDAVSYEDRYRGVMEYLLGNVIVMRDMDGAVALSRKLKTRPKLVTLDGEVISPAGAITGGRGKHNGAPILERKGEIEALDKRIGEAKERIAERNEALAGFERSLAESAALVAEGEQRLSDTKMQLYAKETEMSLIQGALSDLLSGQKRREQELANIGKEEENSRKLVAGRKSEIEEGRQRMQALESEIEGDQKDYESLRDRVREDSEAITKARIAVTGKESEQEKIKALADQRAKTLEQWRREKRSKEAQKQVGLSEIERLNAAGSGADSLDAKEQERKDLLHYLADLRREKQELLSAIEEETKARDRSDGELAALQGQKLELQIRNARQETQLENAKNKLWEEFEMSLLQAAELRKEDFVMSSAVRENREIKARLRELGEVNVGAIEEYASVKERYDFLTAQREDIETSMSELTGIIRDTDRIIRSKFKASFDQVVVNFEEVFRDLYGGGHANIIMTDKDDLFDSEIEITAQPPGKQLKHINLLSGGEKTMTAIALMFAVLKTKPTPCCVLDEIEAALDENNLQIFGSYVKRFPGVQFTLITHQKATMEHADVMYGITMPESGVSKVYSLRLDDPKEEVPNAG